MSAPTITEAGLAAELGLSRRAMRELRSQVRPDGLTTSATGQLLYPAPAAEKMRQALAVQAGVVESPAAPASSQIPMPAGQLEAVPQQVRSVVECTVLDLSRVSTRRMRVRTPDGAVALVQAKSCCNFHPGMRVPCLLRGLVGTVHGRLPRRKGHW